MQALTRIAVAVLATTLLGSCGPVEVYPLGTTNFAPLSPAVDVKVYYDDPVGQPFEVTADLRYYEDDPFLGRCFRRDDAIEPLKTEARKIGANAIIIDYTNVFGKNNGCYQILVRSRAIRIPAQHVFDKGGPPRQDVLKKSKSYDEAFEDTWNRARQYFTENNFYVAQESKDDERGVLKVQKSILTYDPIADCGAFTYKHSDTVYTSLNLVLTKEGDKTNVEIGSDLWITKDISYISGPFRTGRWSGNVHCKSTGVLEQQILNSL